MTYTDKVIDENRAIMAKRFGSMQAGVDACVAGWPARFTDQEKCNQAAYIVEKGLWTEAEARHALEAVGIVLEVR